MSNVGAVITFNYVNCLYIVTLEVSILGMGMTFNKHLYCLNFLIKIKLYNNFVVAHHSIYVLHSIHPLVYIDITVYNRHIVYIYIRINCLFTFCLCRWFTEQHNFCNRISRNGYCREIEMCKIIHVNAIWMREKLLICNQGQRKMFILLMRIMYIRYTKPSAQRYIVNLFDSIKITFFYCFNIDFQ